MNNMSSLAENLSHIRQLIRDAEQRFGRESGVVRLLAVSKTHPAALVAEAASAGQRCFGENYLQEALEKIQALADTNIGADLEWHFIGPIQSNKTQGIAEHFAWVHSVDRLKIAQRLSAQRPAGLAPLNICLQVNISAEVSKSGIAPADLPELAFKVAQLPRLRLRGLMAIPAPLADFERQRQPFRALRQLQEQLQQAGLDLDTLSMGMTDDMEAAIAEGATWVRIGTAIFGPRQTVHH